MAPRVDNENYQNVKPLIDMVTFSPAKPGEFDINLKQWVNGTKQPYVFVKKAKLGAYGPRDDKNRGLQIIDFVKSNKKGTFMKFNMGVTREAQAPLYELCKGVYDQFLKTHSPTIKSLEYQNMFDELTDGTMVSKATNTLVNTSLLATAIDNRVHKSYESPAKTYGQFLFGESESDTWYLNASVNTGDDERNWRLCFYDSNGKQISTRSEDEVEVYKKGGVPLTSTLALKNLVQSQFYKKHFWNATCVLRLYRMKLVLGVDFNQQYFIYPQFLFSVSHSIRMDEVVLDKEDSIDRHQRDLIFDQIIFEDVSMPSRKRKRVDTKVKKLSISDTVPLELDGESNNINDDEDE